MPPALMLMLATLMFHLNSVRRDILQDEAIRSALDKRITPVLLAALTKVL